MSVFKRAFCMVTVCAGTLSLCTAAQAEVWVLAPSLSLDQRFDDNYLLLTTGDGEFSATRVVGELGLSRESEATSLEGLVRIDGLLTTTNEGGEETLDSNQIAAFDARFRTARSRYGASFNFKQDTPSRDIAADLSDPDSIATDTGLNFNQAGNVSRQEFIIAPEYEYDVSRRLIFDIGATLTLVEHDLPEPQDAIFQQHINSFPRNPDGSFNGTPLSFDEVTIDDVGVFTPSGELDDFFESELDIGFRYKYSPITTLSFNAGYSRFVSEVEADSLIFFTNDEKDRDPRNGNIFRTPRRDSISTTATFTLGFERQLSRTLKFGVIGGVFTNSIDNTDTLRPDDTIFDFVSQQELDETIDELETDTDGWLASISLSYDAGLTRYEGRFAVDVEPSSLGSQVESNELTASMFRVLSPRLDLSIRARAFEPDRLGVNSEDSFSRRFVSFEPLIQWKYTREWTVSAAYRYRRQKSQTDPISAESNAILLGLKYTPASKVRDAAQASGL